MPKRTGLTFERHRELGAELYGIRARLIRLDIEINRAYGPSSRAGKAADRITASMETLRSRLDGAVFAENPSRSDSEVKHCYYPIRKR